nr:LOW QUALITY PROTEIN: integrin alpha-IIb [Chelonoidis abingdonii]
MAGAQGPWLPLPPLWLWCWVQVLLAPPGLWPARAFNLHSDHPTIYTGPHHSYFGFAMDFFQGSKGGMSVVVGAPRANTSQPGVVEAGAVYLCPWAPGGTRCSIIEFDPKGDQAETNGLLQLKTYKSHQWFGASVSSWGDNIVACAPLQHWNVFEDKAQATQTPVGTCFVATEGLSRFAEYSPCRCQHMEAVYQKRGHCLTPSPSVPTAHSAEGPHAGRSLPTPLGPRFTLGRPNPGIWLPRGPSSSLPAEEAGCGALTNEGRQRCQLASRWPGQMSGFLAQPGSLAMPSEDHSQTPQGQPPNIPQLPLPQERGTNAALCPSPVNDKRYCELGFSATITHAGRLVLGAPGGYYFVGLIYSVNLSAVVSHVPGSALLWSVAPEQVTEDMYNEYDDAYRGLLRWPWGSSHGPRLRQCFLAPEGPCPTRLPSSLPDSISTFSVDKSTSLGCYPIYYTPPSLPEHPCPWLPADAGAGSEPAVDARSTDTVRCRPEGAEVWQAAECQPFREGEASGFLVLAQSDLSRSLLLAPGDRALPFVLGVPGQRLSSLCPGGSRVTLFSSRGYVVGIPTENGCGEVEIFMLGSLWCWYRAIQSEQDVQATPPSHTPHPWLANLIAKERRHQITGKDDILVGAPLYMVSRSDHKLYEVGRVYLYLQHRGPHPYRHPAQTMTGTEVFGRFGTAIAPAGDLDQDGYVDVAVGAPFAGSGRVLIFRGCSEGLRTPASQVLESPFPGRAAFGFSVRGATDIDANGYPDVLVGAFGASKVAVYRAQPVVVASSQLLVPDVLNPEEKACAVDRTPVSCFTIQAVVRAIKGKSLRENKAGRRLCSGRLKPKIGAKGRSCTTPGRPGLELQLSRRSPEARISNSLPAALTLAAGTAESWDWAALGQHGVPEQTRIVLDCGEDNVCVPELQLAAHTPVSQLFIGAENVVHILADATNVGEGAFEAELRLQLPHDAHYQKATSNVQGLEKLICNLKKENETRVVICELGNPMKNGTKITVDMALSISNLEDAGDTIEFQLQLWSKNSHSPHSNMERVQIPIKAAARLDLRGNSLPATMVLPVVGWELAEGSRRLEDHGPKVEHVYQLHNQGPGTVSQAELWVEFPNKFQGDFLLYMVELSTEGRINCSSPTGLNPLGLEGQKPTASPGHNMSYQLVHRRERREADKAEAGPGTLRDPTLVNCSSQSCVAVLCKVEMLERDQRAMVTVHSILWMQSVWKRPHDQFIIQSQAWFNVSAMPYRIQPEVLPSGHATAHTEVVRVSPDAEKEIPTWWVVLAVLAGLLLLALFICALWKMGFFKRTRPPMDDQEELTSDETREPCTGKGQ